MTESLQKQIDDLREWVQRELELRDTHHTQLHREQERAIEVARASMERRLEGMNEFRGQLDAQSRTFVSRDIVEALRDSISTRLTGLELAKANLEGRLWTVSGIFGALLIIIGIAVTVLR